MQVKTIAQQLGLILLMFTQASFADELYMFTGQVPTAQEMAAVLFPELSSGTKTEIKTRSVKFGSKKKTSASVAIGIPINFDFASYQIREDARPFLDQIGLMMNLEKLHDKKIIIEGHSDSIGTYDYNQTLSENRAKKVKEYLMSKYNISADRLLATGKGESALLPGRSADDPMNRRVQFYPVR